jgi:hypothetical protein
VGVDSISQQRELAEFVIDKDLDIRLLEAQFSPGLGVEYDYQVDMSRKLLGPIEWKRFTLSKKQTHTPSIATQTPGRMEGCLLR